MSEKPLTFSAFQCTGHVSTGCNLLQSNVLNHNELEQEWDIILNSRLDKATAAAADDKIARFEVLTVVLMNIQ